METARLFVVGHSQAVRLPNGYRFEGEEVYIKKTTQGVLLLPKDQSVWDVWERDILQYDEPLMEARDQPREQQAREGLDAIFD